MKDKCQTSKFLSQDQVSLDYWRLFLAKRASIQVEWSLTHWNLGKGLCLSTGPTPSSFSSRGSLFKGISIVFLLALHFLFLDTPGWHHVCPLSTYSLQLLSERRGVKMPCPCVLPKSEADPHNRFLWCRMPSGTLNKDYGHCSHIEKQHALFGMAILFFPVLGTEPRALSILDEH